MSLSLVTMSMVRSEVVSISIEPVKLFFSIKLQLFTYPSVKTCVLGAQNNRLIETVLLSTHNICFGLEIRKINLSYTLLSGGLYLLVCFDALHSSQQFFSRARMISCLPGLTLSRG